MDERIVAAAARLKADRLRCRRVGVILGIASPLVPIAGFSVALPLVGAIGAAESWMPIVMWSLIALSPAALGSAVALMAVGLRLAKRERVLIESAYADEAAALAALATGRRRDGRVALITSASIFVLQTAAVASLAWMYQIVQASQWVTSKAPDGSTVMTEQAGLYTQFYPLYILEAVTGPMLVGAASVLLAAAIKTRRRLAAATAPGSDS